MPFSDQEIDHTKLLDLHMPAMFMNFVLVVIRKHPCQMFQEGREEMLKGMPQDGKPSALADDFQLKAAKAMMNEQLESYGRTGVPLDKCNA